MNPRGTAKIKRHQKLKQFSEENGFELLTPEWLGNKTKHRFLHTESGRMYESTPSNLFNSGFPKDLRSDLDHFNRLKQLAEDNGFELNETKWLGSIKKYRFVHKESNKVYEWTPAQLFTSGFPMTEGQRYLTQEVCRQAFVHIFGGEFKTNRDRLKAINGGKNMELDGYENFECVPIPLNKLNYFNKEGAEVAFNLPIAFEFQGHSSHQDRIETIERDKLKARYCKEEGILLVQIEPKDKTFWNLIRDSEFMYDHICKSIQQAVGGTEKINFPTGFKINLSNWNTDKEAYAKLKQLSEDNGFELKEKEWLGNKTKHRFLHTKSNKVYEGMPINLFNKGFPKDLRSDLDHFNQLKKLAEESGFELKESEWLGNKTKHRFLHKESNKVYEWTPNNLFRKGFPTDLRSDLDHFNRLKQLSDENGFELKETKWLGHNNKHRFLHTESGRVCEWMPKQLFSQGFPKDLRSDLDLFNQMKRLAEENGFELKETKWLGTMTKHRFLHTKSNKVYEGVPNNLFSQGFPTDLRSDLDFFNQLKRLAEENGFELKESEWMGAMSKHRFVHTESGKVYEGVPGNLFKRGFPKDLRSDLDHFNRLKQLADENGFELLTREWLGALVKHQFQHIESGNKYEGIPSKINSRGFPKRFPKQDQPLPAKISPTMDGINMVTGQTQQAFQLLHAEHIALTSTNPSVPAEPEKPVKARVALVPIDAMSGLIQFKRGQVEADGMACGELQEQTFERPLARA